MPDHPPQGRGWLNRAVVGIILATFFSDVSHEMCTAVLPMFLATVGLGPAALGLIEGAADLLSSLAKLGGGVLGHHVERKRPWASLGYLVTALATAAMGLVSALAALVGLRSVAWIGRGFRSPLRDFLLADAVEPTHYGRAYGLERAGDMLGAVVGPLTAALLVWLGVTFQTVILWTAIPGCLAAWLLWSMTSDTEHAHVHAANTKLASERPRFPALFWLFLIGVSFFGLGDFSRTFLIWLAARGLGENGQSGDSIISIAVLLYALHNLVSAAAAYPCGYLGDRCSKTTVLVCGYGVGVVTNLLLAFSGASLVGLTIAIVLSGVYIAAEETLEKAAAAQLLPRELRSLGLGVLACANALGDMASSMTMGLLLESGHGQTGFLMAAGLGAVGVAWLTAVLVWTRRRHGMSI